MRPITASDLMNPEVLRLRSDVTLQEAAAFLLDREISGAPVEDESGAIVGLLSLSDIAAVVAGRRGAPAPPEGDEEESLDETLAGDLDTESERLLVRDVMTEGVEAVPEDATVQEVAERLLKGHVHRLLVTRGDEVVGILSTSDLLGLLLIEEPWR
jgi:CBS domain-containing protein